MMKKLLYIKRYVCQSGTISFCMYALEGSAMNDSIQIALRRDYPIKDFPGPSRVPSKSPLALQVIFDEDSNTLLFYDEHEDNVTYLIYNEEGAYVMEGVCAFDGNHLHETSLEGLNAGVYTIVVRVNNIEYTGLLDIM